MGGVMADGIVVSIPSAGGLVTSITVTTGRSCVF